MNEEYSFQMQCIQIRHVKDALKSEAKRPTLGNPVLFNFQAELQTFYVESEKSSAVSISRNESCKSHDNSALKTKFPVYFPKVFGATISRGSLLRVATKAWNGFVFSLPVCPRLTINNQYNPGGIDKLIFAERIVLRVFSTKPLSLC